LIRRAIRFRNAPDYEVAGESLDPRYLFTGSVHQ
jgi:hypothetical protein